MFWLSAHQIQKMSDVSTGTCDYVNLRKYSKSNLNSLKLWQNCLSNSYDNEQFI